MMPYKKEWGEFIPDGMINLAIASWQNKQPSRVQNVASPSTLLECPRVIWLRKHAVEPTNVLGWGKKQRFLLGRQLENMIANQLKDEEVLLHHWKDDIEGESAKFEHGVGEDRLTGTPDLLLQLSETVISDSKTSRSDSFKFVPIEIEEIWEDPYWYKFKMQLTAYFMLCHWNKDWFETHKLPLPTACHLFSYALDDGIVRRELTWKPTKEDISKVEALVKRWNRAYTSEEPPKCTCDEEGLVKFCPYGEYERDESGKKIGKVCVSCCDDKLIKLKG